MQQLRAQLGAVCNYTIIKSTMCGYSQGIRKLSSNLSISYGMNILAHFCLVCVFHNTTCCLYELF